MAPPPHTGRGCWTCYLRRKKCSNDSNEHPDCSTCKSLNITCHGYGQKPDWMDGGLREKEMLCEVRCGVKATTDRLRSARAVKGNARRCQVPGYKSMIQGRGISQISFEPREKQNTSTVERSGTLGDVAYLHPPSMAISQRESNNTELIPSLQTPAYPTGVPPSQANLQVESNLLVYFLDVVFPAQFPFYKPSLSDGDRSWILCLLLQTRPLHSAALSVAACHQSRLSCPAGYNSADISDSDQRSLYIRALMELREHIDVLTKKEYSEGLKNSIEILACVVLLITFEVAKGGTENWQKHMMATPSLQPFLKTYCSVAGFGPKDMLDTCSSNSNVSLTFVDHAAVGFFSAVIMWFDILGCASTGLKPQYAHICLETLGDHNSMIQLPNIMGCENWTMVLIREIAVLHDWKRRMAAQGTLDIRELIQSGGLLEQRLRDGIIINSEASWIHRNKSSEISVGDQVVLKVTRAFASAAQVYLEVIISGPNPELLEIRKGVSATLEALLALPDPNIVRSVTWPFCIAGCMATRSQQQAFKDLALTAGFNEHKCDSSWRALEVMERCWEMRESPGIAKDACDWFGAMEQLGHYVLLV